LNFSTAPVPAPLAADRPEKIHRSPPVIGCRRIFKLITVGTISRKSKASLILRFAAEGREIVFESTVFEKFLFTFRCHRSVSFHLMSACVLKGMPNLPIRTQPDRS
jgi:hypothetical protein